MSLNSFDLYLANRIQEFESIPLFLLAEKFNKSEATIRRSIDALNDYLPNRKQITIKESLVTSHYNYNDLILFIESLKINDYSTNQIERFNFVISLILKNSMINLSKTYDSINVSQSTKKNDRIYFQQMLHNYHLDLVSYPGKGISIKGNEKDYRILMAKIIYLVIDLDNNDNVIARKANTPINRVIFMNTKFLWNSTVINRFKKFTRNNQFEFNYTSKKFLLAYIAISEYRILQGNEITSLQDFNLPVIDIDFYDHILENRNLSCIMSCLDNNGYPIFKKSQLISKIVNSLISYVEENIITTFYTKDNLQDSLEKYLYKCYFRNSLLFDFYDNKLDDVPIEFPTLFNLISKFFHTKISTSIQLDHFQLSTITLIFREHVLKNKIFGRNKKRIIIVTNSAKEKTDFFSQQLAYYFDIDVIDTIDIQEIYLLKQLKFDIIFTFSNRISTILSESGFPNIKVNYYFHDDDINSLIASGLSLNFHRKILADNFSEQIYKLPNKDLADFLKETYSNFFI